MRSSEIMRFVVVALVIILFPCSVVFAEDSSAPNDSSEKQPIIRDIRIEIRDIFEDAEQGGVYDAINSLKVNTRSDVVRRELLFRSGDVYDKFLLEESARNLRALPFLRRVRITPFVSGDVVDIVVSVQDTWTLYPEIGLSSGGGSNKRSIGLAENDLLGFGKRLEALYAQDEGRDVVQGVWEDPRLLGTYNRLLVGQFESSDGSRNIVYLGRPFRSLVEKYSWSVTSDYSNLVAKLYKDGTEDFLFRQRHAEYGAGYTIAGGNPEKKLYRLTFGYEYSEDAFQEADQSDFKDVNVDPAKVSHDPALLAANRLFSGPKISLQIIEPDYISLNYLDRFDRVEDYNLGSETNFTVNTAAEALGSDRDTLLISGSKNKGFRLSPSSFIRGELGTAGRVDHIGTHNGLIRGELKYYNVLGAKYFHNVYLGRHTLAASCEVDFGEDLDRDRQFLLGASSGLRGYEDKAFSGDHRMVVNLEDRFHLIEDIYKLASLGGAFFVDAGGASTDGLGNLVSHQLYGDFGVGVRIGLPRSSNGNVIRIDLAFPVRDAEDGSRTLEPRLLVSIGQLFRAKLRSEELGPERANVSIGLTP